MSEELENEEQVVAPIVEEPVIEEEQPLDEPVESEEERLQREQERLQREQEERERAEEEAREQARLQAIQEHENYLNSFPETTVFYDRIIETDTYKCLGSWTKSAYTADSLGFLDNHYDESELTLVGTIYYLKGYEKPEQSEEEKMKLYAQEIERQIDEHLQELASSRGYDDVKSCCGYYNSSDEIFQKEARAMTVYRDHLYRTGYNIIEKCQKGEIDYRTVTLEYVLSLIDPIEW